MKVTTRFKKDIPKHKKKSMVQVVSYFKTKNHVKLSPKKRQKLKLAVFDRDGWQCVECGSTQNLTLSHKIHAGMGGGRGPGDTMENTCCMCMSCHVEHEQHLFGKQKELI